MLNTILHTIKSNIEQYALESDESENKFTVRFVDPNNGERNLYPEAINIALFGSVPEKDIMGNATFNVPTTGNLGIAQKAPLKLSIDLLLLFNFTKYATALECYEQVLGFFYNHDVLNISFDGYDTRVEVLLSSFNDRNEIEIWNSFNTPGIPMLRYFFRYVLISGKMKQLPVVRNVGLDARRLNPVSVEIDAMIMNFIYYPIEGYIQGIVQKTTSFCSINIDEENKEETIEARYNELIESYNITLVQVNDLKKTLEEDCTTDPVMKKEFEPFIPSINGLELLLKKYQKELKKLNDNTTENYAKICALSKSNVEGKKRGLSLLFIQQLYLTTEYLSITTNIDTQIISFNTVGDSVYAPLGKQPYNSFKENQQLSLLQLQKKWWDIEDLMKKISACYATEIENPLLDKKGVVYENFIDLMTSCNEQISTPLEEFTALNDKYNNRIAEITSEIKDKYKEAYINAYEAVNYMDNESVRIELSESMQCILIKLNI